MRILDKMREYHLLMFTYSIMLRPYLAIRLLLQLARECRLSYSVLVAKVYLCE